jgi:outer membrane murein-binding lipoprotein Lpp
MIAIPLLWKAIGAVVLSAALIAGGIYIHKSIEEAGYDRAIRDVAAKNAAAVKKLDAEMAKPRSCRDRGLRFDQSSWLCVGAQD